ncbi:hypothetical protein HGRIS_006802 [Hohenbuehelia grisea]
MPPRKHNKKLTVGLNPYPKVSPSADAPTNDSERGYLRSMHAVEPKMLKGSGWPGQGVLMKTSSVPIKVYVKVPDYNNRGPGPTPGATTSPAPSVWPKAPKFITRNLPIGPQPGFSKIDWCHRRPRFPVRQGLILKRPVDTRALYQLQLARSFGAQYR